MNHIENNGVDVFYRVSGSGNGVPVILVHGLAGDSRFFHNQLRFFGNTRRTIAIDLPGHGKSSAMPAGLSIETYSSYIEEVVKKEKIDSYILAGHSMGGIICLENYLKHKDRVKAMVLVSTSPVLPVTDELINASVDDFDSFFNMVLTRVFHKKAGIFILAAKKSVTEQDKKIITADLRLCSKLNYDSQLQDIDIPVLLIANRFDRMIPAALTEDMQKKIRSSRIVLFDNEGHVPFFENSDEFNNVVNDFIESVQ